MTSTITKEKAQAVSTEIKQAVEEILTRHNMNLSQIRTGHGEWFEFKVTATAIDLGLNGVNMATKEAQYYQRFGWTVYGHGPDFKSEELIAPLGTMFTSQGKTYLFAGCAPSRKKYPIVATEVGKTEPIYFTETVVAKINKAATV